MSLQRVSVATPLVGEVDPEAVVPVFHDWIRQAAVEGLLIDVARYAHVHHGPGVLLIGHEGDYSIDLAGGRTWLKYTLKRDNEGTPAELVARAAGRLAGARERLAVDLGVELDADEIVVRISDRLTAPNTPENVAALRPQIEDGLRSALGEVQLESSVLSEDPREPLGLRFLQPTPEAARTA